MHMATQPARSTSWSGFHRREPVEATGELARPL